MATWPFANVERSHPIRDGKDVNIEFPTEEAEIEFFLQMISDNAPRISREQIARMRKAFDTKK